MLATGFCIAFVLAARPAEALREGADPADAIAKPHVIVLSLDTARADYLGCYGSTWVETPALDAFARQGVLFENCMSVAPTTLASHTSLFTGKYPHTHGTPRNGFAVNTKNVTLAEVLSGNGYHCAAFIAAFPLNRRFGLDRGFDFYDDEYQAASEEGPEIRNQRSADQVTAATLQYLEQREVDKPLFLFVHYFDPPGPYGRMYDDTLSAAAGDPESPLYSVLEKANRRQVERLKRYAGEMTFMDSQIGRLFEGLRILGIFEKALILVTSDHGESLLDHKPYFDHGQTVYQDTLHIIAMYRLPGAVMAGTRVPGLISNIDIFPSVLNFLGIELPAGVDGMAVNLSASPPVARRTTVFGQATKPHGHVEHGQVWPNMNKARVVRKGANTFIQVPYADQELFFDLRQDPRQQVDRVRNKAHANRIAGLRERLEAWANSAAPLASSFELENLHETIERLEALGYLE